MWKDEAGISGGFRFLVCTVTVEILLAGRVAATLSGAWNTNRRWVHLPIHPIVARQNPLHTYWWLQGLGHRWCWHRGVGRGKELNSRGGGSMHGLTVGAGMSLVNAGWQCKAIKSENNAISRRLHSSCRRCPEFLEPLDCTQPFASHTNNHQLSALAQPDLGKAHLYLKLQQSVNGGLCPFKALTPDEFMTPLCLLFLKQSTPGLQKLHTFAHCSLLIAISSVIGFVACFSTIIVYPNE